MFKLIYAKSVVKDLRKITPYQLTTIKKALRSYACFPIFPKLNS